MENVTHLWNVVKFLNKFDDKETNQLRTYYVQRCRQHGKSVELPKQCFGPSVMCSHCGSLWAKVEHRNRLIPAKTCSNSIKKMIRTAENDSRLPRYRSTLIQKCLRNKTNKMVVKCSACLNDTQITCKKPEKQKSKKPETSAESEAQKSSKKKKRRSRDRTAGLNLSFSSSFVERTPSKIGSPEVRKHSSPLPCKEKKETGRPMTPLEKLRKINKDRLSNILKNDKTKKRNSLDSFLKELY